MQTKLAERRSPIISLAACVLVLLFAAASAAAMPRAFPKRAGGPMVVFDAGRVRATGATPGAAVYFASVSLYTGDEALRVVKPAGVVIADAGGRAELVAEVHARSVWLVIDPAMGYTVAAPLGMVLREMDLPGEAKENGGGQLQRLLLRRFSVDAFLIRPGEGIWTAYFRDGGPLDEDAEPDGKNHADLADLEPVGGTAGPAERFEPGDYLFLVDRNSLEFHVARRGPQ
jgi:hypothetical protein